MYNCPKCDAPFEFGTKFCQNCGCNLEQTFIINPICPICHKTYQAGSAFCSVDGAKLVSPDKLIPRCVVCGTQYPDDTKFCPKDGALVIPEAYRDKAWNNRMQFDLGYEKASLGARIIAALIDGLVAGVLSIPSAVLCCIGFANISYGYYGEVRYGSALVFFIFATLLYFAPLAYNLIKDGLEGGQSIGKKAMNIKVISLSDKCNCTKGKSALRALITMLLGIVPIVGWLVEPIMVISTVDGRRLADKVAGTIVVKL